MPEDKTVQRALSRPLLSAFFALSLLAAPMAGYAQSNASGRQVDAFLNGIELDRQLAEQYAPPDRATVMAAAGVPTVTEAAAPMADEAAMDALESELDAALAEADEEEASRTVITDTPPSLVQTLLLVLAGIGLLGFAGVVLTMALRELKKDEKQRKRTYRRRVRRRTAADDTMATAA